MRETAFQVNEPAPEQAQQLAQRARTMANDGDLDRAVELIEKAIRLDSIGALNDYYATRADIYLAQGDVQKNEALEFYNHANRLQQGGRIRDAILAYGESHRLDPKLLWAQNNEAWALATHKDISIHDGPRALEIARYACEESNFSCWAFLNTLAAAHARSGNFDQAVGWIKASMSLAPPDHQKDTTIMLRHYQLNQAYIDEGLPIAAGLDEKQEILQPSDISNPLLCELLNQGSLEAELDPEGPVVVTLNGVSCLVEHNDCLLKISAGSSAGQASNHEVQRFIHQVNTEMYPLRAFVNDDQAVCFDYCLVLTGGATRSQIQSTVAIFYTALATVLEQFDTKNIFE